jgi:hypothetical protein
MFPTVLRGLREHFDLHAETWYDHYTPKGHLNIVATSYKCRTWALAICETPSPDKIFARLYESPDSEIIYHWDTHRAVVGRNGPFSEGRGDDGLPPTNQCVAVEVYSIAKTSAMQKARASFADLHNLPKTIMSKLKIKRSTSRASTVKR